MEPTCAGFMGGLLLLAPAGCRHGEPLNPDPGAPQWSTAYVLRSAGGAAVPAVWISNESVTITVVADTIRLREGGQGHRVLVEEYREGTPAAPRQRREAGRFDYARRADRIEISLPCADIASCVAPPHSSGGSRRMGSSSSRRSTIASPLRYERVSR
jgi:hypothetical protein